MGWFGGPNNPEKGMSFILKKSLTRCGHAIKLTNQIHSGRRKGQPVNVARAKFFQRGPLETLG